MLSFPHFAMPSVHPGHSDHSPYVGSDRLSAVSPHGRDQVRVAVGGRVIERELGDHSLVEEALPEAIDF